MTCNYQMPVPVLKRETRIPIVKCVWEKQLTCNPNGKRTSLVIYERGNTIPGKHITMTPD